MAAESESQFSHLLKPSKDLVQNWNFDVSAELERYLTALEHQDVATNTFAHAALVLQSLTTKYSNKVEYLLQLAYQSLEQLSIQRKTPTTTRGPQRQKRNAENNWTDDEFFCVPWDKIVVASSTSALNTPLDRHSTGLLRRIPLCLLPREDQSTVSKLSSFNVHLSGALLPDDHDSYLFGHTGDTTGTNTGMATGNLRHPALRSMFPHSAARHSAMPGFLSSAANAGDNFWNTPATRNMFTGGMMSGTGGMMSGAGGMMSGTGGMMSGTGGMMSGTGGMHSLGFSGGGLMSRPPLDMMTADRVSLTAHNRAGPQPAFLRRLSEMSNRDPVTAAIAAGGMHTGGLHTGGLHTGGLHTGGMHAGGMLPMDDVPVVRNFGGAYAGEADSDEEMENDKTTTNVVTRQHTVSGVAEVPPRDPWTFMDEHAKLTKDKQLVVGKTWKIPPKVYRTSASDATDFQIRVFDKKSLLMHLSTPNRDSRFSLEFSDIRIPQLTCERWGLGRKWIDFEDLLIIRKNELRQQTKSKKSKSKRQLGHSDNIMDHGHGEMVVGHVSDDDDDDGGFGDGMLGEVYDTGDNNTGDDNTGDDNTGDDNTGDDNSSGGGDNAEDGVNAVENVLMLAQKSYAEIFSLHIASLNVDEELALANEVAVCGMHQRVSEWRVKVDRWMAQVEANGDFDYKVYRSKLITQIQTCGDGPDGKKQNAELVGHRESFRSLAKGHSKHEVGRLFLTSLIMTNQHQIKMTLPDADDEAGNNQHTDDISDFDVVLLADPDTLRNATIDSSLFEAEDDLDGKGRADKKKKRKEPHIIKESDQEMEDRAELTKSQEITKKSRKRALVGV